MALRGAITGASARHARARLAGRVTALVLISGSFVALPAARGAAVSGALVKVPALGVARGPVGAHALGAVPAGQRVSLDVVLASSDPLGLQTFEAELYDPSSPKYHQWLTPGQFSARFGPAPGTVVATDAWLRSLGLRPGPLEGFAVPVAGTAGSVARAFGLSFENYRDGADEGYVAVGSPLVPNTLANGAITTIEGLQSLFKATPALRPLSARPAGDAGPAPRTAAHACAAAAAVASDNGWYTLPALGAYYGFPDLTADGLTGSGETVGVFELAPHDPGDVATYASCFGLTNPVSTVTVGPGPGGESGNTVEADLDIEQVMSQAPGASVVSYEGPNDAVGLYDTYNAMINPGAGQPPIPQVISTSWGICEDEMGVGGQSADSAAIAALDTLFQQAAVQGQSVFAAAGDSGSEDCWHVPGNESSAERSTPETDYPASSPYVTAVGGTYLSSAAEPTETVWNDCLGTGSDVCALGGGGAGGGGVSRFEPLSELPGQPEVQPGHAGADPLFAPSVVTNQCSTACRQVPDISSNAGNGEIIYSLGGSGSAWEGVGGTSTGAPLLAGLAADRNSGCTATTGDFAPALYSLYDGLGANHGYGTAFNPITSGDNDLTQALSGLYAASHGDNLATGIGSPMAQGLSCPEVTSVVPALAPAGSTVSVFGFGLEDATIRFGSAPASVVSATATQAVVKVPSGAGNLTVSASGVLGSGTQTASFDEGTTPSASELVVTGQPPASTPAGPAFPVSVSVEDSVGDTATGTTVPVTLALTPGTGTPGSVVSCPVDPVESTAGVASFVCSVSRPGTGYTLSATSPGLASAVSSGFTVTGQPSQLAMVSPPPTSVTAGSPFSVQVAVEDSGGNVVAASTTAVSLVVTPGTGSPGASLSCAADPVIAEDGMAFLSCSISPAGSGYTLTASSPGLPPVVTGPVSVSSLPPAPSPGYDLVASDGGVFGFDAPFFGSMGDQHLNAPIVAMASTPDGVGYWFVASDGGIFNFGDAPFFGSMGGHPLNAPIVGMAPDPATGGYWLVASDGGVFGFGAPFFGSMGGQHLDARIVAMAPTPDGGGYWLLASDGGVFNFGDAAYDGSMGGHPLDAPIVGMAPDPATGGYWLVASDGGVFGFDAPFLGSMGGQTLNARIVGMAATADGQGYWFVASDGGIFNYGDADFEGSMGGQPLNAPVVSMAAVG